MIVKINGSTIKHTGNPQLGRNAKEERDSGKIKVVTTRKSRFETYDRIDITTSFGIEQYVVQADNPKTLNANEYEHNLTLIENMAFFDTVFPADRTFRVLGQTVEDILNVYKRELSSYHNIEINWDLSIESLNTIVPFKEFGDDINMSQILQSIFWAIDAVPKVTRVNDVWEVFAQYYKTKNNLIPAESTATSWSQNNIDYATRVKSKLKNAVNENSAKWFPSDNGYVLPRSSSYQKVESKLNYSLDSRIIAIDTAQVIDINFNFTDNSGALNITDPNYSYDSGTGIHSFTNWTVDITDRVIQEQVWDLKPVIIGTSLTAISTSDNKKNYIRYKVGERYLTNLYEKGSDGIIFTDDTKYLINTIVRAIFIEYGLTNEPFNLVSPLNTEDVKARFKYVRQRDMDVVHSRKTKGPMNRSTTIHQQRDSSVEAGQYLKNLKLYSNRMGNIVYSKYKRFENGDEPYGIFDYTDDNTNVVAVRNTYKSNNIIDCEYEESKGLANLQAEYALRKSSDPYTITSKDVATNLVAEEFIEFSEVDRTDTTRLTDVGKRLALGLFEENTVGNNPLSIGVFKPSLSSWDNSKAIRMPVEIIADGSAIELHVYFDHQSIAGKTYYDLENGVYTNYLNPLPYTNSDGRLDNFELYMTQEIEFNDAGEYPLILSETSYLVDNHITSGIVEPIDLDSNAAFAYTKAFSFVADEWIGIGNKLARDNYLFNDTQSGSSIQVYSSTKPYGEYDQVPRSYDTDISASVSYTYDYTTQIITITPSLDLEYFSLVKDGEILLWFNRTVLSGQTYTVYVNTYFNDNTVYLAAFSTTLSNLIASASLAYTVRLYDLSGSANNLSNLTASADLAYKSRLYDLSCNATNLSNLIASASLAYSALIYYLDANASNLSNITGTADLLYTTRSYDLVATAIGLANITGTTLLTYTTKSYDMTANTTGLANISGTALLDAPDPLVEWQAVSSGTVTGGTCKYESDLGNVKEEEEQSCNFYQDGEVYNSSTDLSTSKPICGNGQTYTTCFPDGNGGYVCQDYVGQVTTSTQLYECQYK